jgi:hypothetical protein
MPIRKKGSYQKVKNRTPKETPLPKIEVTVKVKALKTVEND